MNVVGVARSSIRHFAGMIYFKTSHQRLNIRSAVASSALKTEQASNLLLRNRATFLNPIRESVGVEIEDPGILHDVVHAGELASRRSTRKRAVRQRLISLLGAFLLRFDNAFSLSLGGLRCAW